LSKYLAKRENTIVRDVAGFAKSLLELLLNGCSRIQEVDLAVLLRRGHLSTCQTCVKNVFVNIMNKKAPVVVLKIYVKAKSLNVNSLKAVLRIRDVLSRIRSLFHPGSRIRGVKKHRIRPIYV
jgi:hypothetical protein